MLLAQVEPEGLLGPLVPVRVGNGSVCVEDVDVVMHVASPTYMKGETAQDILDVS